MKLKTFVITIVAVAAAAQYEIDAFTEDEAKAMAENRFKEKFGIDIETISIKEEE